MVRGFVSLRKTGPTQSKASEALNTEAPLRVKTHIQVSDFLNFLVTYKKENEGRLNREIEIFLLDFLPNLQHVMDYESSIEAIISGGFDQYMFTACNE